jgi:hypothetical protein
MTSLSTTSFAGYTFGTWYPTGSIVALTREYTDAVGLQQALQQAEVEDVAVWRAGEVYANYAAYRLQRSVMEWNGCSRSLPQMSAPSKTTICRRHRRGTRS